jgi:hypothetical protein
MRVLLPGFPPRTIPDGMPHAGSRGRMDAGPVQGLPGTGNPFRQCLPGYGAARQSSFGIPRTGAPGNGGRILPAFATSRYRSPRRLLRVPPGHPEDTSAFVAGVQSLCVIRTKVGSRGEESVTSGQAEPDFLECVTDSSPFAHGSGLGMTSNRDDPSAVCHFDPERSEGEESVTWMSNLNFQNSQP